MEIKLLQLNMWGGKRFHALADFLSKNEFDILCFQEVAKINPERHLQRESDDCFADLQKVLGSAYTGKLAIHNTHTPDAALINQGNAIFYKKEFEVVQEHTLWLYKRPTPFPANQTSFEDMGRNALHLALRINNKEMNVVCAHLAWARTPVEQPHERVQNVKLINYMSTLLHPFILTGDFNITPDQPSVLDLEKYGKNLTKEFHIQNTLDPTLHYSWEHIKPGFPVDYIFVSPDVQVEKFEVLDEEHISDHFGLTTTLQI